MAVRALAVPWSVFGTLGGGGSIHQYPGICRVTSLLKGAFGRALAAPWSAGFHSSVPFMAT
eukprot:5574832-Prymnesium_polylepis.1